MLAKNKIDRINLLARKSKKEGLTSSEKKEQLILRQEFLTDFRSRFKQQLDQIEIVDEKSETTEIVEEIVEEIIVKNN